MEVRDRLSTFAIRKTSVPALVETVTLRVTVAQDAEPGERELRLLAERGLTNPLKFHVGQLPEITEESRREGAVRESRERGGRGRKRERDVKPVPGVDPVTNAPNTEVDITLPVTVNGQILPGDVDRYRFKAAKGQQLVVNVSARRLIPYLSDAVPGWFQSTVALFDGNGREVAYEDDFSFHPDPVFHCEIPADGEYVVEIRDAVYRGREDFVYRVTLGELPFVTGVFPVGAKSGTTPSAELYGWNLQDKALRPDTGKPGVRSLITCNGRLHSNPVLFAVDALPECGEEEPNDETGMAQRVAFPSIVNGRIAQPNDSDVFSLVCRDGDRLVAEVRARRLGSPLDSVLNLVSPEGARLAFNDDYEDKAAGLTTHHADSRLTVVIPADGIYHLYLGDTQSRGGPEYAYRLHLERQKPDFELRVVPSSINARAGTSVPITVHVLRRDGFSGEVMLALKEPPPGFALSGARVPPGHDVLRLTLAVPAEVEETPQSLEIEGGATIGRHRVVRAAVPADDVMQAFIYRHLVPAKDLLVAVTGSARSFSMRPPRSKPVRIPVEGTAAVQVGIPGGSFLGETSLELSDPPDGISVASVSLGRRGGELLLRADAEAVKAGLEGNLIVNAFAVRTGETSAKGREQRKKRRRLLGALPAIPFKVVAGGSATHLDDIGEQSERCHSTPVASDGRNCPSWPR